MIYMVYQDNINTNKYTQYWNNSNKNELIFYIHKVINTVNIPIAIFRRKDDFIRRTNKLGNIYLELKN